MSAHTTAPATPPPPSQMHPVHTEPEVSEPHARMIVFTWQLGEVVECGRTGTAIGELVVSHRPDGKAFTASLRCGVRVPHAGTSYRYHVGQPGWRLRQPIARYSRPRLVAYAARALAALREAAPAEIADVFEDRRVLTAPDNSTATAKREWTRRALSGYAPTSQLGLSQGTVAMVIRDLIDQVQAAAYAVDDGGDPAVFEDVVEQAFQQYRRVTS